MKSTGDLFSDMLDAVVTAAFGALPKAGPEPVNHMPAESTAAGQMLQKLILQETSKPHTCN
jgi:hypothetical protein